MAEAKTQIRAYRIAPGFCNILRMIKFEHTLFALPLAFAGVFLASPGWPSARVVVLVLCAMVGARSAAMTFNRLLDASYDARNPRTAMRELPSGTVKKVHAVLFTAASSLLFLLSAWLLNPLCFFLSPIALGIVLFYSFTKRFTRLCHIFLGLSLSIAPLGGWAAATGALAWQPFVLALGILFWVAGFDLLYACMDIDFDRVEGLRSIPASVGARKSFNIARSFHLTAWVMFVATGVILGLGWIYFLSVMLVGVLLLAEHHMVRPDDLTHINAAFFTVNSFVSIAYLAGVVADKTLLH